MLINNLTNYAQKFLRADQREAYSVQQIGAEHILKNAPTIFVGNFTAMFYGHPIIDLVKNLEKGVNIEMILKDCELKIVLFLS